MPAARIARVSLLYLGPITLALAVAYAGAGRPVFFLLICMAFAAACIAAAAYRWTVAALLSFPFVVFAAGTKFRGRDPRMSLSSEVDSQILFELLAYGLLGLILLVMAVSRKVRLRTLGTYELVLLALLTVFAVSLFWSTAPILGAVRAVQMAILLGWAIIAAQVLDADRALGSIGFAAVACALLFSVASLALQGAGLLVPAEPSRFSWFAVHAITSATLSAIALLFIAARLVFRSGRWMHPLTLGMSLAGLALAAILLSTRSRGPLVALIAAFCVLVAVRYIRSWHAPYAVLSISVAALLYLNYDVSIGAVVSELARGENRVVAFLVRDQSPEQLAGLTGRTELWTLVIDLIRERPFLGYGYQSSRTVLLEDFRWASYAHNAFLQTTLEIGLIGAALLVIALLGGLVCSLRRRAGATFRWQHGFVAGSLVFLSINGFTSESFAAAPGFELLLLFLCVLMSQQSAALTTRPGDGAASSHLRRYAGSYTHVLRPRTYVSTTSVQGKSMHRANP